LPFASSTDTGRDDLAMTARANWRDDAACRDADPELFFPIGTAGAALRQIGEAKRICRACPAQTQCLAWALHNRVTDGVWGGTTEDERRAIRGPSTRMSTGSVLHADRAFTR
jgi:WhiB family transcriptional regulator, redox-sensing transcriptional regulator